MEMFHASSNRWDLDEGEGAAKIIRDEGKLFIVGGSMGRTATKRELPL
jgi:hypothetical protein